MKPLAGYISFTGQTGSYAELPLAVLAGATTFTIEARIATTSTKNTGDAWTWGTIVGREIPYFGKDDGGLCVNGGKLCFWCSPASKGTSSSNIQTVTSDATVNDGEIHEVAVVSSNGAIDLYCDGVNVAHNDNVNAKITDAQTILLAYDSDSNSYLQMDLYEARFWNVARSAAEIFANITGTETGLQGWYLPTADGLKDYSGNDRHATLYGSPAYENPQEAIFTADVERVIKNSRLLISALKAWLPFDESTTLDRCGNEWTAYGTTSISDTNATNGQALQLNKGYLRSDTAIEFGGADFTVDFCGYMDSTSEQWAGFFCAQSTTNTLGNSRRGQIAFHRNNTANTLVCDCYDANGSKLCDVTLSNTSWLNGRHHFELDYSHVTSTLKIFIDGRLSLTQTITLERLSRYIFLGVNSYDPPVQRMVGTIDEFRLFDGVALHTASFTPPTSADYAKIFLGTFDVERKLSNVVEFTADVERKVITAWRYFNAGTADTLTVTGTTLTDLPETKSVTGTAFYQTARAKCFDLPTTDEIWIKFDVYFDGTNRWRAYNDSSGGGGVLNGISAQQTSSGTGTLSFFASTNQSIYQGENVTKKNQLQTVLLHMISGATAGVIEAWVDGAKIYTYTGDVNHGEDFADIYLQSDGSGTFFSNVVISNKQLTFGDGYQKFTVDVERRVKSVFNIEFTADVARLLNPEILADVFSRNLVAWLPFDKTPTFDVKLNTWTAHGDLTVSETGAISGKALQFNGRGFVVMSEPVKFFGRQRFTIACWFSGTEAATADGTLWWMDNLAYSYTKGNIYLGFDDTGRLWLQIYGEGNSREYTVTTSTSFLDGNKHFAKVVLDSFRLYLFVDGELIGKTEYIFFSSERQYQLYVGDTGVTSPRYGFKMTLDEFTFWVEGELYERFTTPPTSADYDFYKSIPIKNSFTVDVERRVIGRINVEFSADTVIFDVIPVIFAADVIVCDTMPANFTSDVEILDVFIVEFTADVNRAIKAKLKLFAIDSSEYFSDGLSSSADLADDEAVTLSPVVIPPQETIPAAPDNTIGLQSIEISLSEQQLTDNVSFVGVVPFDIMYPVQGQYLDYVFDMRVERVQQKGVLYTCDCCVDVDQLLYTQLAYTVPKSTDWHSSGESTDTVTNDDKSVSASYHASSIARTIGKTPVIQFDNFSSTVLTENLGGATYADLIRDVFGWSSRVPTHMINVFIRNDKIYFVQRGHEAHLLDLTGTKHTIPIITHELVRMTWGSTPWSQTETREVEVYRPPTTSTSSSDTGSGTGDDSGSGSGSGTGTGSGDNPGTGTGTGDDSGSSSGSGDVTIEDPEDDDDKKSAWSNVGQVVTEDSNGRTVTTYTYDKNGVLKKTVAEFTSKKNDKESNTKTTTNSYNSDGLIRQTSTTARYPNDFTSNSRVVTTYGYLTLADGKKFLSTEMVSEYDANDKLVDQRVTTKSPTGRGQGTSDDDAGGSSGSGNIGDDRVTPYQLAQANKTGEAAFENALGNYDSTWDKALKDYTSSDPVDVDAFKKSFDESFNDAFSSSHEGNYYTERQSRTLNGLSLYDSSFPIHNVGKLMELTEAIRWLNRRTKETVTMTIYEYPHLIDFNDRILFDGAQYFLVSNVAMTNARVFNEQRVTFTRWY